MRLFILSVLFIHGFYGYAYPIDTLRKFYEMSVQEIDTLIRQVATEKLTKHEKIVLYSTLFLGTPYDVLSHGDGPYARYDTAPLLNFKSINCMTFCEQVLALSLSTHYEEMFNILQHIRYKDGIIGMATRNHYTIADWVVNNQWCLTDVTSQVGGKHIRPLTRTISHRNFFLQKGLSNVIGIVPDRTLTIKYIPKDKLTAIIDQLQTGDIVSVIQDKPGIFSAHMGIIIKNEGAVKFRHSSSLANTTVDVPYTEYIESIAGKEKLIGMCFFRIRENVNLNGRGKISHGKIQ